MRKNYWLSVFSNDKNSRFFFFLSSLFWISNKILFLFHISIITNNILTLSILVNRKFKMSGCLFLARRNCRAKKRLAFSGQLSPISVNQLSDRKNPTLILLKVSEVFICYVGKKRLRKFKTINFFILYLYFLSYFEFFRFYLFFFVWDLNIFLAFLSAVIDFIVYFWVILSRPLFEFLIFFLSMFFYNLLNFYITYKSCK